MAGDVVRLLVENEMNRDAALLRDTEHLSPVDDRQGMEQELPDWLDQGDDARRRLRDQLLDVVTETDPEDEEIADVDDGNRAEVIAPTSFSDETGKIIEQLQRDQRKVAMGRVGKDDPVRLVVEHVQLSAGPIGRRNGIELAGAEIDVVDDAIGLDK